MVRLRKRPMFPEVVGVFPVSRSQGPTPVVPWGDQCCLLGVSGRQPRRPSRAPPPWLGRGGGAGRQSALCSLAGSRGPLGHGCRPRAAFPPCHWV